MMALLWTSSAVGDVSQFASSSSNEMRIPRQNFSPTSASEEAGKVDSPSSPGKASKRLVCTLAIDCDYQFLVRNFEGDTVSASKYVRRLTASICALYERDANITIRLGFLHFWTSIEQPYVLPLGEPTIFDLASLADIYFQRQLPFIYRNATMVMTGQAVGGGVDTKKIWDRGGTFAAAGIGGTQSTHVNLFVAAHELGHCFGSPHTSSCFWQDHGYLPRGTLIDSCSTELFETCFRGNLQPPPRGGATLMSTCAQRRLALHPLCARLIRDISDTCCLPVEPVQPPTDLQFLAQGDTVRGSWRDVDSLGATSFEVRRSGTALDPDISPDLATPSTEMTDFAWGRHFYRIRTVRDSLRSSYSGEISVLSCGLERTASYPTSAGPRAMAVGDFNGDGIPDLAVGVQHTQSLAVYPGTGAVGPGSQFGTSAELPLGAEPGALVMSDFNRDGASDVAVVTGQSVQILLGNQGSGPLLQSGATITLDGPGAGIVSADFNGDGNPDLAVATETGNIDVITGHGDGTFARPEPYRVSFVPSALAVADLDGDGIPDIVALGESQPSMAIFRGSGHDRKGDGTFGLQSVLGMPATARSLVLSDLDKDSIPDIAVACDTIPEMLFYRGLGGMQFGAPQTAEIGGKARSMVCSDLDGDGRPDLAVAHDGGITVLLGSRAKSTLDFPVQVAQEETLSHGAEDVAAMELAGDQSPDLIASEGADARLSLFTSRCSPRGQVSLTLTRPAPGEIWVVGQNRQVTWFESGLLGPYRVDLSRDGGATWETIADSISGSPFIWKVTGPPARAAMIRVWDEGSPVVPSSASFEISNIVVKPRPVFSLGPISPNPHVGALKVRFTLPAPAPATLELLDVAGRRVRVLEIPPGQSIEGSAQLLRPGDAPAGVYVVRLTSAGRVAVQKVCLLR